MLFFALLPLLQLAAAAPAPDAAEASITKRGDGSGVHFVNCDGFSGEGTDLPPSSSLIYCSTDSNCDFLPSSDNTCTMGENFWFTWEGSAEGCTFPTGTKFDWFINADAQSSPDYTHVGDGGNQYRAYAGYKDDQHTMFYLGNGACRSIYYFI
ncbi:hypothetical protein V8C35DRAFT_285538 [Trichoderma chlorosporum]